MKVNDPNLAPNAALTGSGGAGKANLNRTAAVDRSRSQSGAAAAPQGQEDNVQLSSLGSQIRELAADSPQRTAHVDKLAALYASGNYKPDAHKTAAGIINDASKSGT